MKKSVLYMGIVLTVTILMTATQVLAAPVDPSSAMKPKKTPPGKQDPISELTPAPKGNPSAPGQMNKEQKEDKKENKKENKEEKAAQKEKANFRGVVQSSSAASLTIELKEGSLVTVAINEATEIKYPTRFMPAATETEVPTETVVPTETETPAASETPVVTETPVAAGPLDGMEVSVKAVKQEDESWLAIKVMVIPGKPVKLHHVGVVTAYVAGESIEITSMDGAVTQFLLTAETKFLPAGALDLIKVGDTVTIICPRTLGQTYTAAGVVLHGMPETGETEEPSETPEPSETAEPSETIEPSETVVPSETVTP